MIAGREKQKLGDAVGPDAVRRQHRPHQAALGLGAAPLARDRRRVHLRARRRAGAARERRRDRAQAGRRRRLARQRRHRPLPGQPHRPRRALSRGRHALARPSACTIPTSISVMERDDKGRHWILRKNGEPIKESRSMRRWRSINFKLDIDADGIALVTWDMPGSSMNVIDLSVIEELSSIVEQVAGDAAIKGAVDHLRQGHVLRRRRPHAAGNRSTRTVRRAWPRARARRRRPRCCSTRAASCRSSTGGSRPAASRGSPRSTAPRSAAASSCASPAISASPPTTTRPALGLPEIKIGLFPGAGGTQRIARMMAPADALQFLLKGDQLRLNRAKAMKLIDAVVPAADLIKAAKDWIKAGGKAKAPWDVEGFRLPGGPVYSKAGHDDVPGGERDLPPRDLRQLSGRRARSCRWSTRACSCRSTARCASSRATSPRSCARRKRRR